MKRQLRHPGPNPTVDAVVLRTVWSGREILMIRRRRDAKAEAGKWALPGGFHDTQAAPEEPWRPGVETAEQACMRELVEETRLDVAAISDRLRFVGRFEGGGRDPRDSEEAWSRSDCFVIVLPSGFDVSAVHAADDAEAAEWFPVSGLPDDLAFDHADLIKAALEVVVHDTGSMKAFILEQRIRKSE